MDKIMKFINTALLAALLSIVGSQAVLASDSVVRECGDLSTTVATLSAGILTEGGDNDDNQLEVAVYQAAVGYFLARFTACECRAELFGEPSISSKRACFTQAKVLATSYYFANLPGGSLGSTDFISDELLEGLVQ